MVCSVYCLCEKLLCSCSTPTTLPNKQYAQNIYALCLNLPTVRCEAVKVNLKNHEMKMIHIQKKNMVVISEPAVSAAQEVLKNYLLSAHTCFCPGPEIDDHITHSKANSVKKKYPHNPPAAHIHYSALTSTLSEHADSVLECAQSLVKD